VAEALTERVTTADELDRSHAISARAAADTPRRKAAPRNEMASITCSDEQLGALVPT
jgi:hypothetical protein